VGPADPGAAGGVTARSAARRLLVAGIIASALPSCARRPEKPSELGVVTSIAGADTRVELRAAPHLKINARLAPALELDDGTILRFTAHRLTPDSAYFAEPPSALLAGRHDRLHGTLRASVCRDDESVCRSVAVRL
jgi:hypothetical protein